MLSELEKKFCKSLKKYVDKNSSSEKGYITKLAEKLGISQSQLSNLIASRKASDEETRRHISSIIGIEYDVMIGLKDESVKKNGNVYELKIPYRSQPIDKRLADMHNHLDIIYKHGDDKTKSAIEMNLISFRKTIDMEINMAKKDADISSLKEEIESLKKTINSPGG